MFFFLKNYDRARDLIQPSLLPADLLLTELSINEFFYDINQQNNFDKFRGFLFIKQNPQTK